MSEGEGKWRAYVNAVLAEPAAAQAPSAGRPRGEGPWEDVGLPLGFVLGLVLGAVLALMLR